jgi:AMMECR1 domain-containing protein
MQSALAISEAQTDKRLPPRLHYVVSTSEFDDVKTRVAILENREKVTKQDVSKKPTLRRQTEKDDESSTGEDRPTLKHRETD